MKNIKEIDKLLSDDINLDKYLENLEKQDIEIPNNLNSKILFKINNRKKKYYINICKIAACLVFCLGACRTDFIKDGNFKQYEVQENQSVSQVQEKVSEICTFLTTPINKEGKDL